MKWETFITIITLITLLIYFIFLLFNISGATVLLFIPIILGGLPLSLQIFLNLIKGKLGTDVLAALALITAVILSQYVAAVLIVLMLSGGQALETYAKAKASSILAALAARMPAIAHRKINEKIEDIAIQEISPGDRIVIFPHEICPVDGVVIEGQGRMDESYLTGEPFQIEKTTGSQVISGAINGDSLLIIHAEKMAVDSRYASIIRVLEEAEQKRPQLRRLGDQLGALFAPIALIAALFAYYFTGDPIRYLAVLVIATPCPLLIAIPITLISAISRAAKAAIIIRDPTVLERLPTCTTAIFDKTGTLTYGKPHLTEIISQPFIEADNVLQYVASLERYSKHPLSFAIIAAAKEKNLTLLPASHIQEKPGQGLIGNILQHQIQITSRKKLLMQSDSAAKALPTVKPGLECIILIDSQYAATFIFHDAPREDSAQFITHLTPSHQFNKIMLVSGDREEEVAYLASQINFSQLYASQSPEQKLEIVKKETALAPTVFMGDGINDAPALTAATVGLAFGSANQIAAEAAGAVIMGSSLTQVDTLIHLSIKTRRIALQSALGGMLISFIGMGFAAAGYIPPVTGALLQEFIDIIAILNALRLAWGNDIAIDLPH